MGRPPNAAVTARRLAVVVEWNKNKFTQYEIADRLHIPRGTVVCYIAQARRMGMKVRVGDKGPIGFGAIRIKVAVPLSLRDQVAGLERRIAALEHAAGVNVFGGADPKGRAEIERKGGA